MTDFDLKTWFKAAEFGDIATIRSLIVEGIDVNVRDPQERTAFNIASQFGHTDVMTTILAARQMDYLRQIGVDPYAASLETPSFANENRRSA